MASAWGNSWGAAWGNAWGVTSEASFSQEVELKRWYVRRGKRVLIFNNAQEADTYLEAERAAEDAIRQAQKTSRRARKRLREKVITVAPAQAVDVDQLSEAVARFSISANIPELIALEDFGRIMQVMALAQEMQDEEDIEMLLLM